MEVLSDNHLVNFSQNDEYHILDWAINQPLIEEPILEKIWETTESWETYSQTEYLDFHHRKNGTSIMIRINCQNIYKFYYLYHLGKKIAYAVDHKGSYFMNGDTTTWIERKIQLSQKNDTYYIFHENERMMEEICDRQHLVYTVNAENERDELIHEANGYTGIIVTHNDELFSSVRNGLDLFLCDEQVDSLQFDVKCHDFIVKYVYEKPQKNIMLGIPVYEGNYNYSTSRFVKLKQTHIFDQFVINTSITRDEYYHRYTFEYRTKNKLIARFRFIGINDEEAIIIGRTIDYRTCREIDPYLNEELQRMLLPGFYGYENKKKKFLFVEKVIHKELIEELMDCAEKILINVLDEYPQEIFNVINDVEEIDMVWPKIMTYVSNNYGVLPLNLDTYLYTPVFPIKCDHDNMEIPNYQCSFVPELGMFNISYILGSIPYYTRGGGTVSSSASGSKDVEMRTKPDFGIKVNTQENKIIINNENSEMVEVDIMTKVVKPVTIGFKYATAFFTPAYPETSNWFMNLFKSDENEKRQVRILMKLELYEDSKTIVHPEKSRTNHCKIIDMYDPITGEGYFDAQGIFRNTFKYHLGEEIIITDFVTNSYKCDKGIHFCNTIAELKRYFN